MKKRKVLLIGLICAILIFAVVFLAAAFINESQPNETVCTDDDNCGTLHWVRDESRFIDYTIEDDTAFVRYAFVFENHSDLDYSCSQFSAKLPFWDLWGWMKYEKFFTGIREDGSSDFTVAAGEKIEVIMTFSGTYTGGTVNNNLSLPTRILFLQRSIES